MIEKKKIEACINLVEKFVPCEPESSCGFEQPPVEEQILGVESEFDIIIPPPIRDSLTALSFRVTWDLCEPDDAPEIYEDACAGTFCWDLDWIKNVELRRRHFTKSKLPKLKISDEYWNQSFAFSNFTSIHDFEPYDGFLAIDLTKGDDFPVIILDSYHKSICHGATIAPSLTEFLDQMCSLAFVTANTNVCAQLTGNFKKPLDSKCEFAKNWLHWLTTGETITK